MIPKDAILQFRKGSNMSVSLAELIKSGFGIKEDYNCTEKIVRGANITYDLGLPEDALLMMGGFGGGMGLGETCGTITGAVAVISAMLVKDNAHSTPDLKSATQAYIDQFRCRLGDEIECRNLRPKYRTKETGCDSIIIIAAEILDQIVK